MNSILSISIAISHVWVRVLGYGISISLNKSKSFSERNGHRMILRIGQVRIELLKP